MAFPKFQSPRHAAVLVGNSAEELSHVTNEADMLSPRLVVQRLSSSRAADGLVVGTCHHKIVHWQQQQQLSSQYAQTTTTFI